MRRGLATSRTRATALVESGNVLVSGAPADKAARLVAPGEPIEVVEAPRFVSRGGLKLEAALDAFAVTVEGRRCLDAGASTGGFTDCLLQRGAATVAAVDVGKGQLDWGLRGDDRVEVHEEVNVRHLGPDDVGGPADVVVADLSFISLAAVAPALAALGHDGSDWVVLVKPQFEAGRERVGKGGVVRDPGVHHEVLRTVRTALGACGLGMVGVMPSPIRGASGNVEFLAHLRRGAATVNDDAIGDAVERAATAAP